MKKIAINGFGRIGRSAFKVIADSENLRVVAVNDLMSLENAAYLLQYDSIYGTYPQNVRAGDKHLWIEGTHVSYFSIKDPGQLPWDALDIDIVIESTGLFTSKADAASHIEAGADRVVISGPTKSEGIPTVIYGVNSEDGDSSIISCASCTTNNISTLMEILGRRIGITKAMLNTTHAYTASQSLVDGPSHKDPRRGRTAAANLVPTTSGAARATTRALPEFREKFDGIAVRTPVPAGCISDITFIAESPSTVGEVNHILEEEAQSERYSEVIDTTDQPVVSNDILQTPYAAVIDLTMTKVVDGDMVKILAWYDNEWGFVNQMIRQTVY
ncbi:MAG: glyceraldehyde 3-phosphate dehydrogenase NAD-binding domain-containing protein [Balneolaceae bacterium]|nr:glyceraldehyde 3-phosphate dehydrogenase NAD-binding domain-containing protein [Balneolaceae bacterium]